MNNQEKITIDSLTSLVSKEDSKDQMLKAMEDICHSGFIPNPEEQLSTMKNFINGNISYAEMRNRCG